MSSNEGLHGSNPAKNAPLAIAAEGIGTFFFLFIGFFTIIAMALFWPDANPFIRGVVIGMGFGFPLWILISTMGIVSGAHFNPAVTLGLAVVGKFPNSESASKKFTFLYVLGYWFVQFLASYLAYRLARIMATVLSPAGAEAAKMVAPTLSPNVSILLGVIIEGLFTYFLVLVIIMTATNDRFKSNPGGPIGGALAVGVLIGGFFTGGSLNPARAWPPIIDAGLWEFGTVLWVYTVAPLVFGLLAAFTAFRIEQGQNPGDAEA